MVITFERHTQPLTEKEEAVIPMVIEALKVNHRGKENAVCNKAMRTGLKNKGYSINETGIRKIITYIRVNDLLPCLCSCGEGYFVPETPEEIEDCIQSQQERINSQRETLSALRRQYAKAYPHFEDLYTEDDQEEKTQE